MSGPDARNPLLEGLRRPVPRPVRLRGASGLALVFGEVASGYKSTGAAVADGSEDGLRYRGVVAVRRASGWLGRRDGRSNTEPRTLFLTAGTCRFGMHDSLVAQLC